MHGRLPLQARFAALVAAAIRLGDRRLLDKLMAPVDAALARLKEEPLAPDLMLAAQEADMAEELAEARFHADPSHAHRHQWAAAVRHQRAQSLRLLLALEAE